MLTTQTVKTVQAYPRIVKKVGESPEQYPEYDDEEGCEEDEDFI